MKQVPEKLQPWLIVGWFVALFAWNLYFAWSPTPDPSTADDYNRILLVTLSLFLTPAHIVLSVIVIGALFIKWKW
jgi:hypothetical protein